MKFEKFLSLILAIVMIAGIFVGCSPKNNNSVDTTNPVGSEIENIDDTISVTELKQKYGEVDDGKMFPLYNLNADEPLSVSVKYTPKDERELFSIHTDEKCLEASEVALMWSPNSYMPSGPKTYEVYPIIAPLYNSMTEGLWGNVSTYYIKFNYDIDAETETKLEEPVIVPISIKSPVEIPNTNYQIENGCFSLNWSAVEGATSYKIYQRQVIRLLEDTNIAPAGKEEAYNGTFPLLVKEVGAETLSFNDWLGDGKGGMSKISHNEVPGGFVIGYQNQGVNGEYYVTAVINGKESLFSKGVSTSNLSLPNGFEKGKNLLNNSYDTTNDLPATVGILYVDGSVKPHTVSYEAKDGDKTVTYRVDGTSLIGIVTVKDGFINSVSKNENEGVGGFVEANNNIPQNAPSDIPTIKDNVSNDKVEENTTVINTETSEPKTEVNTETIVNTENIEDNTTTPDKTDTEKSVVNQQRENTKEILKEANKEKVKVSKDVVVNADSAAEEYLALNMIEGKTEISVVAFPEIQDWNIMSDVLCKVIYQNPLILGVESYGYDYGTMTLIIKYKYTTEEIVARQKEILSEGKKIIESIITVDMNEAEKRRAIYDYLEKNTEYDNGALENAEKNGFRTVDEEFRDSFSTYGILVNKIGVCQSYAYTFDYLCELADVECILVTGDVFGYLPHAWNKVKINNEWFVIDVTNNEKSIGIEDFMYENPDYIASALGYIEDDLFFTEEETGKYVSSSAEYTKYKDCTIDSKSSLESFIKENVKTKQEIEFIATYSGFDSSDVVSVLYKTDVSEITDSKILGGYVWFKVK